MIPPRGLGTELLEAKREEGRFSYKFSSGLDPEEADLRPLLGEEEDWAAREDLEQSVLHTINNTQLCLLIIQYFGQRARLIK